MVKQILDSLIKALLYHVERQDAQDAAAAHDQLEQETKSPSLQQQQQPAQRTFDEVALAGEFNFNLKIN